MCVGIGLDNPKTPKNIGSVMRAAGCYGADLVVQSGRRCRPGRTDTGKQWRHIPLIQADDLRAMVPYGCVPIAVDLIPGAICLTDYRHPKRAFYIFGPEDGTLGRRITSWCKDTIYIPTAYCMNLAATVNVVLYDRMLKKMKCEHIDKKSRIEELQAVECSAC